MRILSSPLWFLKEENVVEKKLFFACRKSYGNGLQRTDLEVEIVLYRVERKYWTRKEVAVNKKSGVYSKFVANNICSLYS